MVIGMRILVDEVRGAAEVVGIVADAALQRERAACGRRFHRERVVTNFPLKRERETRFACIQRDERDRVIAVARIHSHAVESSRRESEGHISLSH